MSTDQYPMHLQHHDPRLFAGVTDRLFPISCLAFLATIPLGVLLARWPSHPKWSIFLLVWDWLAAILLGYGIAKKLHSGYQLDQGRFFNEVLAVKAPYPPEGEAEMWDLIRKSGKHDSRACNDDCSAMLACTTGLYTFFIGVIAWPLVVAAFLYFGYK